MPSAEYMREYRAKRKAMRGLPEWVEQVPLPAIERIAELEEEVAMLKRELAARPADGYEPLPRPREPGFGHSRPAPKSGKR